MPPDGISGPLRDLTSIPHVDTVLPIAFEHRVLFYSASGIESFTQGLGAGAFLAFLMAIVNKKRAATEYAVLSSIFAFSCAIAGWAGGYGAENFWLCGFLYSHLHFGPARLFVITMGKSNARVRALGFANHWRDDEKPITDKPAKT